MLIRFINIRAHLLFSVALVNFKFLFDNISNNVEEWFSFIVFSYKFFSQFLERNFHLHLCQMLSIDVVLCSLAITQTSWTWTVTYFWCWFQVKWMFWIQHGNAPWLLIIIFTINALTILKYIDLKLLIWSCYKITEIGYVT